MKYGIALFLVGIAFLLSQCKVSQNISKNDLTINLRWNKSYLEDPKDRTEIGLQWILTYLGANMSAGLFEEAIEWKDEHLFTLDLGKLGYSEEGKAVWAELLPQFRASEEYKTMGGMDLGRFEMLTFNSSWHYYAFTGVSETFKEFKDKYEFEEPIEFYEGESGVAKHDRIVYLSKNK